MGKSEVPQVTSQVYCESTFFLMQLFVELERWQKESVTLLKQAGYADKWLAEVLHYLLIHLATHSASFSVH